MSAAVGAKTARACDYCIRRRARWYCAADDAFLCQVCDGSVHSANALAGRHERVRLKTASLKPCIPSWHRGVHTRPRTPRHGKKHHLKAVLHPSAHVPEQGHSTTTTTTTTSRDDDIDHLQCLYRVPVLDPFVSELCSSTAGESKYTELVLLDCQDKECNNNKDDTHHESFPLDLDMNLDMDMDMAEFAADVESLLGRGLEEEGYTFDELVKAEEEETMPFELSFDYNSPQGTTEPGSTRHDEKREWRMSLRLDYEAIRAAWARKGSPWMNGERPQISPNDCWLHNTMGGAGSTVRAFGGASGVDGGREARVTRYREKRRTRLFSKKIRYEVRKLNAEKRPRMKGRFVKRSSFNPTTPIATS